MAGFEDYDRNIREIELEIERKGIALGIDWSDEPQVRALAREALAYHSAPGTLAHGEPDDFALKARIDLFGLASLMLQTMEESASLGMESHGGIVWKAFGRALWMEAAAQKSA